MLAVSFKKVTVNFTLKFIQITILSLTRINGPMLSSLPKKAFGGKIKEMPLNKGRTSIYLHNREKERNAVLPFGKVFRLTAA